MNFVDQKSALLSSRGWRETVLIRLRANFKLGWGKQGMQERVVENRLNLTKIQYRHCKEIRC